MQYQQQSPLSQSVICSSDDIQGDTTDEFNSNASLNGAADRGGEDEPEIWTPPPPQSPQFNSILENSVLGIYCTKGTFAVVV